MSIEVQTDGVAPREWSSLAASFADYSIYQTWAFGESSASDTGSQIQRLVVRRDGVVIGLAQLRVKRVPLTRTGLAYVYFGPLWRREGGTAIDLADVLTSLREEFCDRRGMALRIVPNLPCDSADQAVCDAIASAGFDPDRAAEAYRTFRLDLTPALEELRSGLAQKWRNGLNQAEKKSVRVEASADDASMARFESLYDAMWQVKQFETGVSVSSFRALQGALAPAEKMTILLAYANDEPVAGHVFSVLGNVCIYLLGASSDVGRECKASYLLQWRAVEAAKAAGARWYDLGGIDPAKNPGVHHFKAGLNGDDCTFLGQFHSRSSGSARYLVPLAERAYRVLGPFRRGRQGHSRV